MLTALAAGVVAGEASSPTAFDEVGHFNVQNFGPEDYDGQVQNWGAVQSPDGLVYVANGGGVLEYDGVSWRGIPISNLSLAYSLAVGAHGRIFVGAVNELGYLAADSSGHMSYVSLVDQLAPEDREFGAVWQIEVTSEGAHFHTLDRLFRWNGQEMKVWNPETRWLGGFFSWKDDLYLQKEGFGLMRLQGDTITMAEGGDFFRDKPIRGAVAWDEDAFLAVTSGHGMFRCSPQNRAAVCTPFAADLTELLTKLKVYSATTAPGGILVITTLRGGALLLDRAGRLLRILDESAGLQNNVVSAAYADRQGGLWLTLIHGLARVELGTSLSYWQRISGQRSLAADIVRYKDRLFAATNLGVSRLAPGAGGAAPEFSPELEGSAPCWSLASTPHGLLAGCTGGVYHVERQQLVRPMPQKIVFAVHASRRDPSLVYLGLSTGLAQIRFEDGQWGEPEQIDAVRYRPVRVIVEDAEGRLWLTSEVGGALRFEPAASPTDEPLVTRFGVDEGLPLGASVAKTVAGRLAVFVIGSGLFRQDAESAGFVPDDTFDAFLPGGAGSIRHLTEDGLGRVWIAAETDSGVALPKAGGGYEWKATALRRARMKDVYTMYAEADGALWVSSGLSGVIRHDTEHVLDASESFPARVRRVTSFGGSLLYDGLPGDLATELPYRDNALRFAFAAPRFNGSERTLYRVRLDGFDDGWSEWTDETDKDYTNLWEGRYRFQVQARDVYGITSEEADFAFRVLPPWYRSGWAYGGYLLLVVGAALAIYRAAYRRQQRKLEAAQRVNRQLREVDRLKDEFLAATSHELRTPLYGITGLAESLADGAGGALSAKARQSLHMIVSSGRRLSSLVDDILDFSKLQRASLALDRRPVDLHALVDIVLTLSRPLAQDKDLALVNAVDVDLPPTLADENRVQQILHNLVGNAIKFTDEGRVEVRARVSGDRLLIEVADTGIGIEQEHRERIFAAFQQADGSSGRRFAGTGLGLAVSRQLVELHGGELWLEASSSAGSTFAFTLPVADADAMTTAVAEAVPVEVLAEETPGDRPQPDVPAAGHAAELADGAAPAGSSSKADQVSILVVDDEPVNRQVLAGQLEAAGYRIVLAADGPEALGKLEEQRFELVLLDVMMPRMSGYEVCRELRERHPAQDLPVLFLTAKVRLEDQVTGLAEGANDYLTKPVAKDALLARVRTQVELLTAYRKQLAGLVPICAECKKIRDDEGYWQRIETFIESRSDLLFSHGMCPTCLDQALTKLNAMDGGKLPRQLPS